MIRAFALVFAFFLGLLMGAPAQAATCTAEVSDILFGAISLRSGEVNRTSGTLTVSCSNALVSDVGVCVRFGAGSGGAGSGNTPRFMTGPTGQSLAYQLRRGGHGAAYGTLDTAYLNVPIVRGQGQATLPIYGEILSNGTEYDTGVYASVFSGPSNIELSAGVVSCDLFGPSTPVPDFRVSAQTVASCELDVGSMNFGQITGLGRAPADAIGTVDIRCTSGAEYAVSMGLGNGLGVSNPTYRKMRSGLSTLVYGLFRDSARSLVWGEAPNQRAYGTGSGYGQRFNVYGRVYKGQPAAFGTYDDSVVVTVHY
ncbi:MULTISPECIES: Csu type fimbrial protein [unclassified Marinovum]